MQGLGRDPEDAVIVQAMISLAHALGLSVVAEGLEADGQKQILEKLECDLVQGFLISQALSPLSVPAFMDRSGAGIARVLRPDSSSNKVREQAR